MEMNPCKAERHLLNEIAYYPGFALNFVQQPVWGYGFCRGERYVDVKLFPQSCGLVSSF